MEDIAREVGKNASTVAYWVYKHGLVSAHAEAHRNKGPILRECLADLALRGLTIRQMAEELGRSYSATRHWLQRYGIETPRAMTLADTAAGREAGASETEATCPTHGWTRFVRRGPGSFRCAQCRQEAVADRRRRIKTILVEEAGGACVLCGYRKSTAALQFHHVDPSAKEFGISNRGLAKSLEAARTEASKCVLLCANCHAEVEAGSTELPFGGDSGVSGVALDGPG